MFVLLVFYFSSFFSFFFFFFFFNDTATTEIYTLSLHDALPICDAAYLAQHRGQISPVLRPRPGLGLDRKSTRLNSSHRTISYAVFCLKKKKKKNILFIDIKKNKRTNILI